MSKFTDGEMKRHREERHKRYLKEKNAQLPGGKADKAGKTASDFNPSSLRKGMKVESEHTPNKTLQKFIAEDHLTEDPKYYEKLELIEKD
jgi:hypothetical protein